MSLIRIQVLNLLSFESLDINGISDINCIIGKNNTGKTNLIKIIDFFYNKLNDVPCLPPSFFSKYNANASISLEYDTKRLQSVIRSYKSKSPYQKHIYNSLFQEMDYDILFNDKLRTTRYKVTLYINKSGTIKWSNSNEQARKIIARIYPFYFLDTRRLDLYDWSAIWSVVSEWKFLNTNNLNKNELVDYINNKISNKSGSFNDYVEHINEITKTNPSNYRETILNLVKVGTRGQSFHIDGHSLSTQSDGTNSHQYLDTFLALLIALTRREFITPIVFVDEPEISLHPKKCEEFIFNLFGIYNKFKKTTKDVENGKYATPYPNIIFSTHSPNIIKSVVKLFRRDGEHKLIHFNKEKNKGTSVSDINTRFCDGRFFNVFSDNEARLFFSDFILFVEGESELELFGNRHIQDLFPKIRRIDIYQTNKVALEAMCPKNTNAQTPYMVLYDADKIIQYDVDNNSMTFRNEAIDLQKESSKNKFAIYGTVRHKEKKFIDSLLSSSFKHNKECTSDNLEFTRHNHVKIIKSINDLIYNKHKTVFVTTTMEGLLINKHSFNIFLMWLKNCFLEETKIGFQGCSMVLIPKIKDKLHEGKYTSAFKMMHNKNYIIDDEDLTEDMRDLSNNIKRMVIIDILRFIKSKSISKQKLLIILRMIFNGKSDSLISIENQKYEKISSTVKVIIKKLRDFDILNQTKTTGWITSFIDFYMANLANKDEDSNFSIYFPEFYDILKRIESSIV